MFDKIIQLLGISKEDTEALDLVDTLIELCTDEALVLTKEKEPKRLEDLIIKMVCERYNTIDYFGISSTSYSGVSQQFYDGYSEAVKSLIRAKRHLVLI